jgi:CheY-like chemotaxis protein
MDRKRILLVDDSNTALMINCMIVTDNTPHEVVTARDGAEAVEVALSKRPNLIVMDVVMPRMTGFEACKELRSHDETRMIPIILVTTRGEEAAVENGYVSGCNDYLTKPVKPEELLTLVNSYLGGCHGDYEQKPQQ